MFNQAEHAQMTFDDRPPGDVPLTTSYGVTPRQSEPELGAAPPPESLADEPRVYIDREGRGLSRSQMIGAGVAAAVALGVGFGVLMGPKLNEPPKPKMERIVPASSEDPRLQIQVTTRRAEEPKVASAGRLDAAGTVVQPEPAASSPAQDRGGLLGALGRMMGGGDREDSREAERESRVQSREARRQTPESQQEAQPVAPVIVAENEDAPPEAVGPDRAAPQYPVRRYARPSFDCRYARSRSELMVCEDPGLAAADRRLARAYRRALDAGAPYSALRRQQDRWMAARERAAVSPEAVRMVYQQRIEELEQLGQGDGW